MFKIKSGLRISGLDVLDENGRLLTVAATADKLGGELPAFYLNASNMNAGSLAAARLPAFSGDATSPAGSASLTLATVNTDIGTFGSASAVPILTVNGKGLVTAASTAPLPSAPNTASRADRN